MVLRIKMGPRCVVRTCSVNYRELAAVPEGLQTLKRGVQPETSIKVDGAIRSSRPWNRNGRTKVVIRFFEVRHNDIQTVGCPPLEHSHENLALAPLILSRRSEKPPGRRAETRDCYRRCTKKVPSV